MPENKNTGRYNKDSHIETYLDSLSPKTPKNKDINVLNEEVFVKKPTTPPFSQQRTIEKRPSVQSQVGRSINQQQVNRQRASSQGVQSRNSVNN